MYLPFRCILTHMTLDFINPDSHVEPDNSPKMRFNNLILELQNLPKGDGIDLDKKRRIHTELVNIAQGELSGDEREKALTYAHQALDQSSTNSGNLDEKYSV